jgi:diamine N-acetyltransferase
LIEARDIDNETVNALIALAVKPDQIRLVAPNSVTIAQAVYQPGAWLKGLWNGQAAVGLIAMIDLDHPGVVLDDDDPRNAAYLWRLMIDQYQQGQGFGREAMKIALAQGRAWGKDRLVLSVFPSGPSALGFYEKLGLRRTGRMVEDEAEMAIDL